MFLGCTSLPHTALSTLNKSKGSSQVYCAGEMVDVDRLNIAEFQHLCLLVDRKPQATVVPYTGI